VNFLLSKVAVADSERLILAVPLESRSGRDRRAGFAHKPVGAVVAQMALLAIETDEPEAEPVSTVEVSSNVRLRTAFENHYDQIWRLLRRFGVPPSQADDATQQVFLILAERMADVREGSERAFLFGTALRTASTLRRTGKREFLTEHADLEPSQFPGTDELADQRRARQALDAILQLMDADLRTVFVLYELQQFTSVEIADILGIPIGTAASRLRRARQQFREFVNERFPSKNQGGMS
jgi:RNA polymerase sigma-70 factor (ECF subfamily)